MLVAGFPADAFGTNCYVVATAPGEQCVVVDPGIGVLDRLDALLAEHRLHPAAVLLTHGHLDHTFSVAPVCGARGITAYVHPGDREMLADPAKGALDGPDAALRRPAALHRAGGRGRADRRRHAHPRRAGDHRRPRPGPYRRVGAVPAAGRRLDAGRLTQLCLSGDVLFAGSIGRTDLPGGSMPAMLTSLRDKILPLADDTVVLPGHGPATTIGRERATQPVPHRGGWHGARPAPTRGL